MVDLHLILSAKQMVYGAIATVLLLILTKDFLNSKSKSDEN
jgi:hypothetical protein